MSDTPPTCKLCTGATQFRFGKTVLGRYPAQYFECTVCGWLQIPDTRWLQEAYATASWAADTGLVARNIQLACTIGAFLERSIRPTETVIDYGGGTGLLTRLLRDMGWQVLCHDPYHQPQFVRAFHVTSIEEAEARVIIASEVFEHFSAPRESLLSLLKAAPIVVFTTELYTGQDENWPYLAPEGGQHIFFFSPQSIQSIAGDNGFELFNTGFLKYLVRKDLLEGPGARTRMIEAIDASGTIETGIPLMTRYLRAPYRHVAVDHPREWDLLTASLAKPHP
jgi:hypothetical protein